MPGLGPSAMTRLLARMVRGQVKLARYTPEGTGTRGLAAAILLLPAMKLVPLPSVKFHSGLTGQVLRTPATAAPRPGT